MACPKVEAGEAPAAGVASRSSCDVFGLKAVLRPDGRETARSMRPPQIELGVVRGPQGSARCVQGLTRAFASVVGPLDFRGAASSSRPLSDLQVQVSVHPLTNSPIGARLEAASAAARASSVAGEALDEQRAKAAGAYLASSGKASEEKRSLEWKRSFEARLQTLLEAALCVDRFPRSLLRVVVLLQQDDGACEAVCFNAAMAALLDAGLPLRWRGWASCVAVCASNDEASTEERFLFDPCADEEDAARSVRMAVVDPRTGFLSGSFLCLRRPGSSASSCALEGSVWRHSAQAQDEKVEALTAEALEPLLVAAARVIDERAFSTVSEKLRLLTNSWGRGGD